jgi:hypothetical protein
MFDTTSMTLQSRAIVMFTEWFLSRHEEGSEKCHLFEISQSSGVHNRLTK